MTPRHSPKHPGPSPKFSIFLIFPGSNIKFGSSFCPCSTEIRVQTTAISPKHPYISPKYPYVRPLYPYIYIYIYTACAKTTSELNIWTWKNSKKSKKSKILGMVRDALGSVGGSSLSIFTGFAKNFEKLKIRKLQIGQNPFKIRSKCA